MPNSKKLSILYIVEDANKLTSRQEHKIKTLSDLGYKVTVEGIEQRTNTLIFPRPDSIVIDDFDLKEEQSWKEYKQDLQDSSPDQMSND